MLLVDKVRGIGLLVWFDFKNGHMCVYMPMAWLVNGSTGVLCCLGCVQRVTCTDYNVLDMDVAGDLLAITLMGEVI